MIIRSYIHHLNHHKNQEKKSGSVVNLGTRMKHVVVTVSRASMVTMSLVIVVGITRARGWGLMVNHTQSSRHMEILKMVSAFRDYTTCGMGIILSSEELALVNPARNGKLYTDGKPMLPLLESPGICIIDPTKAGNGYWNYEKMATQTEDMMHTLSILEPYLQQLQQYD